MTSSTESETPLVAVVDDDASLRGALDSLFRSVGWRVALFGSAAELLQGDAAEQAACLVLDVRLPRLSGLDFQAQLAQQKAPVPIIFMTGHGDIPMSVQAMKAGAIDFLQKPFRDQTMLDAVSTAIQRDAQRRESARTAGELQALFEGLSQRERQIMALVTTGLLNKQIAGEVGLSEITVKIHRGNVMRKMHARTFAELVRMADGLGLRAQGGKSRTKSPELNLSMIFSFCSRVHYRNRGALDRSTTPDAAAWSLPRSQELTVNAPATCFYEHLYPAR